jgi:hypothetical protein
VVTCWDFPVTGNPPPGRIFLPDICVLVLVSSIKVDLFANVANSVGLISLLAFSREKTRVKTRTGD